MKDPASELEAVRERYARRARSVDPRRYDLLAPANWMALQERQRAMLRMLAREGFRDLANVRLVEVGCGTGGNLVELLRIGFAPENLAGVELLPERSEAARRVLPPTVQITLGDASTLEVPPGGVDLVFQSVVFSSLLDPDFQAHLAARMWEWVRPGGAVLWYDFTWNNPRNPDVRGVSLRRVRELFPAGEVRHTRVTLAPPIARRVAAVHPSFYTLFNVVPFLRTHVLCWIAKR